MLCAPPRPLQVVNGILTELRYFLKKACVPLKRYLKKYKKYGKFMELNMQEYLDELNTK